MNIYKNRVVVFAVHPDDEVLMCGGTLLKHKQAGDEIHWVIITNIFEKEGFSKEVVERRQREISQVASMFQFDSVVKLNFPTTTLDQISMNDLIEKLSKTIHKIEPTTLYLPNRSDVHSDHQVIFKAIYSCTKNFRYPFIKSIFMGETISETDFAPALLENAFTPNIFVDISDFFDKKMEIFKVYESEVMPDNLPRSNSAIKALCQYRGSSIGVRYAEAFILLKEIR